MLEPVDTFLGDALLGDPFPGDALRGGATAGGSSRGDLLRELRGDLRGDFMGPVQGASAGARTASGSSTSSAHNGTGSAARAGNRRGDALDGGPPAVPSVSPDDARWPARASADILLRDVLMKLVGGCPDYPELVKLLGSARHIRTPVCGKFSSWAEDRQNQCTERTSQRAQGLWRECVYPAVRHEVWETLSTFTQVMGDGFELNQKEIQHLLELSGWNVSQIVRNQLLASLVSDGLLSSRKERDLWWYRIAPQARGPAPEEVQTGHMSRWLGTLTSTLSQRLYQDPGALWVMRPVLPGSYVQEFMETFGAEARALLMSRARLSPDGHQHEDMVWVRFSVVSGPGSDTVLASNHASRGGALTPSLPLAMLAGDIGHMIGDVSQAEQIFRRYLVEEAQERSDELKTDLRQYLAEQCGVESHHTVRRWQQVPLLLSEEASELYNGGVVGALVNEMFWHLMVAWPGSLSDTQLRMKIQEQRKPGVNTHKDLLGLAFGYLESDSRIKRSTLASGHHTFELRAEMSFSSKLASRDAQFVNHLLGMKVTPACIQGFDQRHPSSLAYSTHVPILMEDVDEFVQTLRAARNRIWDQLIQRFRSQRNSIHTDRAYPERIVIAQVSLLPYYPGKMWFR